MVANFIKLPTLQNQKFRYTLKYNILNCKIHKIIKINQVKHTSINQN